MPRNRHFQRFGDHTHLKHFLLGAYLEQWATILITGLQRPSRCGPRLWFIDAFAGAGRDDAGAPGSPLIAAEIARAINQEHFTEPLAPSEGMRAVAIEANRRRYDQLLMNMEPYTAKPSVAYVRFGTLEYHLDPLLRYIGGDPTFFFLDPFGVEGLDAAVLPRLLKGPRAEILVLFSDEGAVRLSGKAAAVVPTREQLLAERARDPSVFGEEFDAELAAADRAGVDRVLAGHASNPRAEAILNRAFGGNWWSPLVHGASPHERRDRFVDVYERVLREAGALHVLRFAVTTPEGRHKYTLLHASKHVRAYAAMKDAMHRARDRAALTAGPTLFDAATDADAWLLIEAVGEREAAQVDGAADAVVSHFAGRTVRWTGGYGDDTVQAYARDHTPLLVHQFPALQRVLEHRGYRTRKRPAEYTFPAHA